MKIKKKEPQETISNPTMQAIHWGFSDMVAQCAKINPQIQLNQKGELIFDEKSLGILDEHIRKVIHEELKKHYEN